MFSHIVVPLDGSDFAGQALPVALELADRFGSKVTLVRVVEAADVLLSLQRGYAAAFVELTALGRRLLEIAEDYLDTVQAALARQGRAVEVCVVEDVEIAEAILHRAEQLGADAIVMSTYMAASGG